MIAVCGSWKCDRFVGDDGGRSLFWGMWEGAIAVCGIDRAIVGLWE